MFWVCDILVCVTCRCQKGALLLTRNYLSLGCVFPQAFAAQVQHFLGTDVIEPALAFPPGFDEPPLEFSSWSEIAEVCGDSRKWGGMHFEASAALCPPPPSAQHFMASSSFVRGIDR